MLLQGFKKLVSVLKCGLAFDLNLLSGFLSFNVFSIEWLTLVR
jgi:hypothetical protein